MLSVFCTIVDRNYLAQARVLVESFRNHNNRHDFVVLVIDGDAEDQEYLRDARVLLLNNLSLPEELSIESRSYYDVVEFATALKPYLLQHLLLSSDYSTCTYLDPDILVYSSLSEICELTLEHEILLTPHRLTPSNINRNSGEIAFLKYGIFNLGFISVSKNAIPMLNWWGERLIRFGTRFPTENFFTDQKWIDFVPALFKCHVLKDPTLNLAPWNIDERLLSKLDNVICVGNIPLKFIHFSQMSSSLSIGKTTNLWNEALFNLSDSQESLKIIENETINYSLNLTRYKKEIALDLACSIKETKKITNKSILLRRKRRDHYVQKDRFKDNASIGNEWLLIFLNGIILKFERSFMFVYAVEGFRLDMSRIKAKFGRR